MAKYERRNENVVDAFRFDSLDVDKARDLPKWFLTLIAQDRVYQEDAETILNLISASWPVRRNAVGLFVKPSLSVLQCSMSRERRNI